MNTLSLPIRAEGRPEKEIRVEFVRTLTLEDLPRAHQRETQYRTLDKVRSIHHYIALLIASGMPQYEVAQRTGSSLGRIQVLLKSPLFVELVDEKRKALEGETKVHILDNLMRWDRLQTAALEHIQERIEEKPEDFTVGQLLQIAGEGGDRAGPSKKSTQINANFDFADRLAAARKKMFGEDMKTIESPPINGDASGGPSLERADSQLVGKDQ